MSAWLSARTFIRIAGPWLAVMVVFRTIGGFGMVLGLVPSRPILPGGVVPTPSSWTQVFKVHMCGLVQTYLFHYQLEFCCSFRSLQLIGQLRRGFVRVSTSDMGKVPGGFGATGMATLRVRFPFGAGTAPPFLFIQRVVHPRWFRPGGHSTPAGLTCGAAFLEDFWWWRVDSGKRVGERVLGGFLWPSFQLRRWCRCWARSGEGHLKTLAKWGPGGFRRWRQHHPIGGLGQNLLD